MSVALPVLTGATRTCAVDCGAKCCRTARGLIARTVEMRRLKELATTLRVKARFLCLPTVSGDRETFGQPRWQLQQVDGACPFLDRTLNLCRIYEERPKVCRDFPTRPHQGCLLWPGGPGAPRVGA